MGASKKKIKKKYSLFCRWSQTQRISAHSYSYESFRTDEVNSIFVKNSEKSLLWRCAAVAVTPFSSSSSPLARVQASQSQDSDLWDPPLPSELQVSHLSLLLLSAFHKFTDIHIMSALQAKISYYQRVSKLLKEIYCNRKIRNYDALSGDYHEKSSVLMLPGKPDASSKSDWVLKCKTRS